MSLIKTPVPEVPKRTGRLFDTAVKEWIESPQPVELPVYSYQQLIDLTPRRYPNTIVVCSNGDAGDECLAYCDGFNWRVVALGSNISLS